ncbi:MAG: sulfotransferase domain-containing protein [Thiolinea sp.]
MFDPFLEEQKQRLSAQNYAEYLWRWGEDMSHSADFKREAFLGYKPGKQDVIVSTYPKSGTTWMLQLAHQISFLGESDFEHQYDVMPWPDKLIPLHNIELDDMSVAEASPSNKRIIKSHLEAEFIPYSPEAKYISVIRDPKDMLVSMILFENGFNERLCGGSVPVDAFVQSFQSERFQYQSWPAFIDSWWRLRERDNVFLITFEEMKADPIGLISQVADFLGVKLTPPQMFKVAEKTSFAYMKANDHKFAQPAWGTGNVPLVRSGKTGNSKELLSAEQQQQIDDFCLQELTRLGSDFPYQEAYFQQQSTQEASAVLTAA